MSSQCNIDINEVLRQLRAGGSMPEELLEIFSEEAEEHMRSIYDGLDRLRVDSNDRPALGDVRRSSHTLKGAAGAVGFDAVTRLAHRMEDLLDWLGDNHQGPSEHQLQLLLATADQIEDLITTEADFEEAANKLVEIYGQYESVIEALGENKFATVEASDSTEQSASPWDETERSDEQQDNPKIDVDVVAIRDELETGAAIEPDLAEIFAEEADEHLTNIAAGLDRAKANTGDTASLSDVRRSSHTLKGAAGAVGIMAMHRLAYRMERLLDALTEKGETPTDDHFDLLSQSAELLFVLRAGDFEPDELLPPLTEVHMAYELELSRLAPAELANGQIAAPVPLPEVEKTADSQAAARKPTQYLRVPLDRLDTLVATVGEMVVNQSSFSERLADFADRIEEMNSSLTRLRGVANEVETRYSVEALQVGNRRSDGLGVNRIKATLEGSEATDGLDSLEFDRYNDFHLMARSLSEATNDIAVIASELRNLHGDFDQLVNRQQRFNRDAQSRLMNIRMVPVQNIANRLERTVRTVSNKLGKKIDLKISGGNTELDKTVLEEIIDPLLHLLRNAMDHGIETPEQRLAAGKPERSQLRVEALNQGTQVTIRVIDDGRGLNAEKIRARGIERDLIRQDRELSEEEIHGLIFRPGFSTADSLTDVSGRGVGMDVVRESVQRLKGTIRVESVPGQGSTFTIYLPTTLAVANALMVESGGHTFAIPMQSVQQIIRLDPGSVTRVDEQPKLDLGDRQLILKDLANHMEIRAERELFEESKVVMLLRAGDNEVALSIDNISGGQDVVVKSLGDHLDSVPGYLGATVSGDGTVIPILDPADLCGQVSSVQQDIPMRRRSDRSPKIRRKIAMVVDDSLSVRRVTSNLLVSCGWEVIDARDGVDALEKLSAADSPPDVFLCDMEMPRMDGLELISRIRSQDEFGTTPILMVTSRAGEKHRKLAREAGADEHVVKPFNDENLINLVENLVREHRETVGV